MDEIKPRKLWTSTPVQTHNRKHRILIKINNTILSNPVNIDKVWLGFPFNTLHSYYWETKTQIWNGFSNSKIWMVIIVTGSSHNTTKYMLQWENEQFLTTPLNFFKITLLKSTIFHKIVHESNVNALDFLFYFQSGDCQIILNFNFTKHEKFRWLIY